MVTQPPTLIESLKTAQPRNRCERLSPSNSVESEATKQNNRSRISNEAEVGEPIFRLEDSSSRINHRTLITVPILLVSKSTGR